MVNLCTINNTNINIVYVLDLIIVQIPLIKYTYQFRKIKLNSKTVNSLISNIVLIQLSFSYMTNNTLK